MIINVIDVIVLVENGDVVTTSPKWGKCATVSSNHIDLSVVLAICALTIWLLL